MNLVNIGKLSITRKCRHDYCLAAGNEIYYISDTRKPAYAGFLVATGGSQPLLPRVSGKFWFERRDCETRRNYFAQIFMRCPVLRASSVNSPTSAWTPRCFGPGRVIATYQGDLLRVAGRASRCDLELKPGEKATAGQALKIDHGAC